MSDLVYQPLTPLGGAEARIRFRGPFQGREVTWEATLIALGHGASAQPNFIEIGMEACDPRPIRIGLNVPAIDHPTVLKSVIMVRQYRRLAAGRHEYGP